MSNLFLNSDEIAEKVWVGLAALPYDGQRVLVLVPDLTRTMPLRCLKTTPDGICSIWPMCLWRALQPGAQGQRSHRSVPSETWCLVAVEGT